MTDKPIEADFAKVTKILQCLPVADKNRICLVNPNILKDAKQEDIDNLRASGITVRVHNGKRWCDVVSVENLE